MRITFSFALACMACLLFASCSSVRVQKDLAFQFARMVDAGKVPAVSPGAHGTYRTEGLWSGERITYPLSQHIYLTQKHDPAQYTYAFIKDTKTSDWRLTAAWRTFPDGHKEDLKTE